MQYPVSMSVIIVQLGEADRPHAYVSVGRAGEQRRLAQLEFELQPTSDVSDVTDWVRQVMAMVTEAV